MKKAIFVTFVCFVNITRASNYYFSTISGDDNRSSSQAHNPSTPWKSINKLNSFFSSLQPGDSVLFKRGENFYGSITVNASGSSSSPIIISAYGSGNKPLITSLITLSGWKANSSYSGVFDCAANSSLGSQLNMVLINDVQYGMGRYPNLNTANKGYLNIDSHVNNTSITDNSLPSSPNWKGAEVVIRSSHWTLDRSIITSQSGGKISYSADDDLYDPRDNYGYFIQKDIRTLDQLGEWYYNPNAQQLSVYFGSADPSSYTVTAASLDNLVYSSGKSNILFDNLSFKGSNDDVLIINGGANMVVQNCEVSFAGVNGVHASGTNFVLENCTVSNSNNNGVHVGSATSPIITDNVIRNTSIIAGMGQNGSSCGVGIINGKQGLVENNQVLATGYNAINYSGDNTIVQNNYIDSFCFIKDDGAGIYTSNNQNVTNTGRKVIGNIIFDGIGAAAGTDAPDGRSSAEGIYLDANVNGVLVTGNTIANCNRGLYLHDTRNVTITNNTCYNNVNQEYVKHDNLGDPIKNNTITNNIFFSKLSTQIVASFNTSDNNLGNIGRSDSNYYARPVDDNTVITNTTYYNTSNQIITHLNLNSWKTSSGMDASSKGSAKEINPYKINNLIGSNKIDNGTFSSSDISDYWENYCNASWQNSGVLDGGYLKIVPSSPASSIVIKAGSLFASKTYLLDFSLKGTGSMSIGVFLRGSDYAALTPTQFRTISTSRSENEILFTPTEDETKGSLVFSVDGESSYYLDNIKLYEADASLTDPDDSIKFKYNNSSVNKTFSLDGNYVDVKGNQYSNSILLKPYASAILIKTSASLVIADAPIVNITGPGNDTTLIGPADIHLQATADDADGISKVEFFNGTALLHTEYEAPYEYSWSNVPVGDYVITARATDNTGLVTTSTDVNISVISSNSFSVTLSNPYDNFMYTGPATIWMHANAIIESGSVEKVEFYSGSTLLHTEYEYPYSYSWQDVPVGNYVLTAKATDNNGNVVTSDDINISVVDDIAPKVKITSPGINASFSISDNIKIIADATDEDGVIDKVEFYNGTTLLHTEHYFPYSYSQKLSAGAYTITAVATDNNGMQTVSSGVPIVVTGSLSNAVSQNAGIQNNIQSNNTTARRGVSATGNNTSIQSPLPGNSLSTDASKLADFKVYPNPAVNSINLLFDKSGSQMANIIIQNASGIILKNSKILISGRNAKIDISGLAAGTYILTLSSDNIKLTKIFIKINK